jgi:hypothetical protein
MPVAQTPIPVEFGDHIELTEKSVWQVGNFKWG